MGPDPHASPDGHRWTVILTDMLDMVSTIQVAQLDAGALSLAADNLSFDGNVCKFDKWTSTVSFDFVCLRVSDNRDILQTAHVDASGNWNTVATGETQSSPDKWFGAQE